VFYEDGRVYEDIPREGLAGFSRSGPGGADSGYWGTYKVSGSSGTITKPGVQFTEKISIEGPSKIRIDSDAFTRCLAVDGLRLQGAWTSYANPDDPALSRLPRGQAPIFRFSGDGRFEDEGVLATILSSADRAKDGPGLGTYEFRDFTLTLRYEDGRTRFLAFSALAGADPATTNDILFIGRTRFNKRK
jgi:hypothetical protein